MSLVWMFDVHGDVSVWCECYLCMCCVVYDVCVVLTERNHGTYKHSAQAIASLKGRRCDLR